MKCWRKADLSKHTHSGFCPWHSCCEVSANTHTYHGSRSRSSRGCGSAWHASRCAHAWVADAILQPGITAAIFLVGDHWLLACYFVQAYKYNFYYNKIAPEHTAISTTRTPVSGKLLLTMPSSPRPTPCAVCRAPGSA